MASPEITAEIVQAVAPLLDQDLEVSYAALGAQLSQIENPVFALKVIQDLGPAYSFGLPKISIDFKAKAREFLSKYWRNLLKESCDWWSQNKNKYTGAESVVLLGSAIAKSLPAPWSAVPSVLALVAVILIRAGITTLCQELPSQPPTV